jgi:hypothetical protein
MIVGARCSADQGLGLSQAGSNEDDIRGQQRGYHQGQPLPDPTQGGGIQAGSAAADDGGGPTSTSGGGSGAGDAEVAGAGTGD